MDQARILIVDDEPNVRLVIERTLVPEGYVVDTAASGDEALRRLRQSPYDLLLLDLQMEPMSGTEVLQALRAENADLGVIILTAHGTLDSAVTALRLGAFDYLFKPASPGVIRERVREALAKRQQVKQGRRILTQAETLRQMLSELEPETKEPAAGDHRFLRSGKLTVDRHHRSATYGGRELDLTTAEFDMLICLVEAAPETVPPSHLVKGALGYEVEHAEARKTAKWYIHHLRQKVEPDPARPHHILTVRHRGYLWHG